MQENIRQLFFLWVEAKKNIFNNLGYELEISPIDLLNSAYLTLWGKAIILHINIWDNHQCDLTIISAETGEQLSYKYWENVPSMFIELEESIKDPIKMDL